MTAGDLEEILTGPPEEAAPLLLGCHLVSLVGGELVRLRITEVEAYKGEEDPASHAHRGMTERNRSMFQRPGTLYVYRSYGIHHCANTSAGPEGTGWGILFRAGQVIEGEGVARRRRGGRSDLADGPGKVCQALGIVGEHDGTYLLDGTPPVWLEPGERPGMIVATPRIGITKARDLPWRFVTAISANA
ncbi:MAG: DNA-3-methyladenine glycosylase [Actinomycetes bacterium]|jgi:DNA-3-methyladenine glycosylase